MGIALPARGPTPSLQAALSTGTLRLSDGRRLGWAEFGARSGLPLLYCHGTPGCRLEAGLGAEAAARSGFRLIAADRPGYGLSTPAPGRHLADVAGDLEELCRHLNLQRLFLLGVSGGAPFACATACRLGTRVAALGLVSPVGPLNDIPAATPLPPIWLGLQAWNRRRAPSLGLLLAPLRLLLRAFPGFLLNIQARRLSARDQEVLAAPGVRRLLRASLRCALQPGCCGLRDDVVSFARPWEVPIERIDAPTLLWHGSADLLVPALFGELLAGRLRSCRTTLFPGEGHFSLPINYAATVLQGLAAASRFPKTGEWSEWYTCDEKTTPATGEEISMEQRIATFLAASAFGVVGASSNRDKYGNKVVRCYRQRNRTVIPVNPREEVIEGIPCVARVSDLPPEAASISIITPPAVTEQVVKEAIAHGIRNIWMQPGAESAAAIATCEAQGVNLIADGSCLLVVLGYHEH